jgi:hypothetical protein
LDRRRSSDSDLIGRERLRADEQRRSGKKRRTQVPCFHGFSSISPVSMEAKWTTTPSVPVVPLALSYARDERAARRSR